MIYTFVKDKGIKNFLRSSIKKSKISDILFLKEPVIEFFEDKNSFLFALRRVPPRLVILEDGLLKSLSKEK